MNSYLCPIKLYKYTPLSGLVATLEYQSIKLSRPSQFNDPIDVYLQDTIGQDEVEFLQGLAESLDEYLFGSVKDTPPVHKQFKDTLNFLRQSIGKISEEERDSIRSNFLNKPIEEIYDLNHIRKISAETVREINYLFNSAGIFCSTIDNNNLLMWSHYADQHSGALIEYTPNRDKDSFFLASKPVHYSKERPVLYKDPATMFGALFEEDSKKNREIFEKLIYTKSEEWAYEQEYRLFVATAFVPEQELATLQFHPEELTSIYFGCRMDEEEINEMKSLAEKINPAVRLYRSFIKPREYAIQYVDLD